MAAYSVFVFLVIGLILLGLVFAFTTFMKIQQERKTREELNTWLSKRSPYSTSVRIRRDSFKELDADENIDLFKEVNKGKHEKNNSGV